MPRSAVVSRQERLVRTSRSVVVSVSAWVVRAVSVSAWVVRVVVCAWRVSVRNRMCSCCSAMVA